ncbi:hypothetical protein [Amycolatopsis thermoflava]|uniref:hypothetical protein n=1 Tax=Amycolatopsis thermoflava TaxID=84480 RepID=UPI003D72BCFB
MTTRLHRRRAELARRRTRTLLLAGLVGFTLAAVAFFAAGLIVPGLLATLAGLATVGVAGWHARPANWPAPERCGAESE